MRRKREHNLEKKRGGCETENKEVVLELVGAELGIGYNWLEEGSIYIQFCFGKGGGTNKQKHTRSNLSLSRLIRSEEQNRKYTHAKLLLLSRQEQKRIHTRKRQKDSLFFLGLDERKEKEYTHKIYRSLIHAGQRKKATKVSCSYSPIPD